MKRMFGAAFAAILAFGTSAAEADVLDQLGTQSLADGTTPFFGFGGGDPAPFDILSGSDPGGIFGSISFSHNFVLDGAPTSASIELSIGDHDSFAPNEDTLDIFFDGVQQDDDIWRGISTDPSSVSIRTMPVDVALLFDGVLEVRIDALVSPSSGLPGNGIAIDFSTLRIETSAVPVPASVAMMLGGLGLLGFMGVRRRMRG